MGWWIFLTAVSAAAAMFVPIREWKRLFLAGIGGLLIILPIDSTLAALGAFRFSFTGPTMLGLPLPYWLSYFPGGILIAHFRPAKRMQRLIYVISAAALYALIELIAIKAGLFHHLNWNILKAFILNILGFTTFMWYVEWYYYDR